MSPRPVFKPTSKKAKAMREASQGLLNEGQLHRAAVQEVDQTTGYQPPAEAPAPPPPAPPPAEAPAQPELPLPEVPEDDNEPPALIFDLPTKRRRGKVSDDNYRSTSLRIHRELWAWARDVKTKDGWDLADLANMGMAKLKAEWESRES